MRRVTLGLLTCLAIGCGDGTSGDTNDTPSAEPGARPNIILIVLDTVRADHLSHAGWSRETTPVLDAFARDAVRYSEARSTAPWTLPSHMSIFTGLLPGEHGATWAAFSDPSLGSLSALLAKPFGPAEPERMLPRRLKQLGYKTLGLSYNPWVSERTGFGEGFDALYETWRMPPGPDVGYDLLPAAIKLDPALDSGKAGKTLLLFRRQLVEFGLGTPFFLFFNFTDAHYPYVTPREYAFAFDGEPQLYDRLADERTRPDELQLLTGGGDLDVRRLEPFYDASLRYLDQALGTFFDWLHEEGLYDDALIVVTSDHGEHLGELRTGGGQPRVLFSHQLSMADELLRVPLLVKYPGNVDGGRVESHPLVSTLDIYATILGAARAAAQDDETRAADTSALPSALPPLDLARMDDFERPWSLAESYSSDAYLTLLVGTNPDFDLWDHRRVQRVVFEPDGRQAFVDSQPTGSPSARLSRWLADYEASLSTRAGLQITNDTLDPRQLEELRRMGYVGDDDQR